MRVTYCYIMALVAGLLQSSWFVSADSFAVSSLSLVVHIDLLVV